MASIEVSLGWKRRREALLETLPRAARDLVRELDGLHQALKDKDQVIQTLKFQIANTGGKALQNGQVISQCEREQLQEKLTKLQNEMDHKRVAIKNLRLTLDKIDISDNIDVRIRAAELEYELEREELNVLNLQQETDMLSGRITEASDSCAVSCSLYGLFSVNGGTAALTGATLFAVEVMHTPGNPPFHVTWHPPIGCIIDWATDDTMLKKGDRILEVNEESTIGKNLDVVGRLMSSSSQLRIVIARPIIGRRPDGTTDRVDDRIREVKELVARLDKALRDKETLATDNTRLNHRIGYLEDQVTELQSSFAMTKEAVLSGTIESEVTPSPAGTTVIQVYQKGPQTVEIPESEVSSTHDRSHYQTLPRLRSPTSSTISGCDQFSTDVQSLSSMYGCRPPIPESLYGTCKPQIKQEERLNKPIPPKKPERLSLHRTTSILSVDEHRPMFDSCSRYKHWNYHKDLTVREPSPSSERIRMVVNGYDAESPPSRRLSPQGEASSTMVPEVIYQTLESSSRQSNFSTSLETLSRNSDLYSRTPDQFSRPPTSNSRPWPSEVSHGQQHRHRVPRTYHPFHSRYTEYPNIGPATFNGRTNIPEISGKAKAPEQWC